ncbi:MAG: Tol-Pal system beta propeller repeat protein TolB [Chromatiales bacterium]|nr:Tol-Pal system beta propeller repeat protein TolB [Chromatiales bacterium]
MKFKNILAGAVVLAWGLFGLATARAELEIRITKGEVRATPVAIVPFGWRSDGPKPQLDVAEIVEADLVRSGRFDALRRVDMLAYPTSAEDVDFRDWRIMRREYLLIGEITPAPAGGYDVFFRLFDVLRGELMVGARIPTSAADLRPTAHHIADWVYEKITGEKGAFATRIAYVTVSGAVQSRVHSLHVADVDGYNPQTILTSRDPIMSPSWSPDGERLAYVSFEGGRSSIHMQEVYTGRRVRLASFKGINGAPVWSPDGRQLALTLSKQRNPDIYVMEVATQRLRRLTDHYAIDTEPDWAPDGRSLIFTSDRGGGPQLYRISAQGGEPERITFDGDYNARGRFSPDGKELAFVHREDGAFRIAVMNLATGQSQVLTDGHLDESPSFAPNGTMLIYATQAGDRGVLAATSVDGRVQQRLALQAGSVQEPVWGPYLRSR